MSSCSCRWGSLVVLLMCVQTTIADSTVKVSGDLKWKDGQNKLHNARGVKIELWEDSSSGADVLKFTTNADLAGHYSGSFDTSASGNVDVYLKVFAENSAGFVSPNVDGTNKPVAADTYVIQTPTSSVAAGDNTVNRDFGNTTNAERALGVLDMILVGSQFGKDVRGVAVAPLPTRFPHSLPPKPNTSFYWSVTDSIYILGDDRWDWDVVGHEYSHYLHQLDALKDSPGGGHTLGVTNIPGTATNANGQKSKGLRLAWSEGEGNYMGVAMQQVNAAANKFPNNLQAFGDSRYSDTIDSTNDFNLETTAGSGMAGEGEEVAIARILWDIGDPKNEAHDRVERGHVQVYKDLVAARNRVRTQTGDASAKLTTLNQVNDYYMKVVAANDKERVDYGKIFETYSVSPHPKGGLIGSTVHVYDPITFEWDRQNNNSNDTFRLMVWNEDFTQRLIDDFPIPHNVTKYALTRTQRYALSDEDLLSTLHFAIIGADLLDSAKKAYAGLEATGNYWSGAYSFDFIRVPEPSAAMLALFALALVGWRRRFSRA